MTVLFWLSAGLLVYHYAGYPLLLALLAALRKEKNYPPLGELPSLTLLISVYNEEDVIRQRLENCRALDYPKEKLRVLVVSDGSGDATHGIVEEYRDFGIELEVVPGRVGKTGALNQVIPALDTDLVVFTDANSMLRPDALRLLVRPFTDPRVGAVCGELELAGDAGAEGAYWRYEKAIKQWESRVSTLTVANGALYALRKNLHRPMNPQAANDFQHPLQVALQGYITVYEPRAIARESGGGSEAVEAQRRVRIIARGWKGLGSHLAVLNPFKAGFFTFQFVSRKLLRWLGPVFMAAALAANLALAGRGLFSITLAGQGLFYGLALLGAVLNRKGKRFLPAYLPYYFCLINWSALRALVRVILGRDSARWTPTPN
jgi:glycosyltransferase involved in cell wall biosynthesis